MCSCEKAKKATIATEPDSAYSAILGQGFHQQQLQNAGPASFAGHTSGTQPVFARASRGQRSGRRCGCCCRCGSRRFRFRIRIGSQGSVSRSSLVCSVAVTRHSRLATRVSIGTSADQSGGGGSGCSRFSRRHPQPANQHVASHLQPHSKVSPKHFPS